VKLLDQFITQTGKQPIDWTQQDIQKYLDYIKKHVTEVATSKKYDN
jgi:hypothetical protein